MITAGKLDILIRYLQKKIFLPISAKDYVLDVGGGDKPFWRANVILDKYLVTKSQSQRFTGMPTVLRKGQTIVEGDAQNMPFKTDCFDFVFCSHLLEHVIDPAKTILEIMRVGKKGIIEVPRSCFQKIEDMPSHLWFTRYKNGVLYFDAKKQVIYDDPDYQEFRELFQKYNFHIKYEEMITTFFWDKKINFKITGKPNTVLLTEAERKEKRITPKKNLYRFYKYSNLLASILLFWKRYNGKKELVESIKCPNCSSKKNLVISKKSIFTCIGCQQKIRFLQAS